MQTNMRMNLFVTLCAIVLSMSAGTAGANPAGLLNLIDATVTGSDNLIHITQEFRGEGARSANTITLSVAGNGNGAGHERAWRVDRPVVSSLVPGTIAQQGADNAIAARITGNGNLFAMAQHGTGNRIDATITGNGNQASVAQTGTGNVAGFSQTGNGNVIAISQSSW